MTLNRVLASQKSKFKPDGQFLERTNPVVNAVVALQKSKFKSDTASNVDVLNIVP